MVSLPEFNIWFVPKCPTTGFRLGYYNVTLGTITTLKHQCVVWCKHAYFSTSNRLGILIDRQTDGETEL